MAQRLTERFAVNTAVEISFATSDRWHSGIVIAHDPPGVWVQTTANGQRWFVTNGRRIRPAETPNNRHGKTHDDP